VTEEERRLVEKLLRIEALYARAGTEGERAAAGSARERIRGRLRELEREDPAVEFRIRVPDAWSGRLLLALLRRYGIEPYRYSGQRSTSVMVRTPRRFLDEVLMPEYQQLNDELTRHFDEVTQRVIARALGESDPALAGR